MKAADVYALQNSAIHAARAQLEHAGIFDPETSLEEIRDMAGEINQGIRSISNLSLEQRRALIDRLISKGAEVKNPTIYDSDLGSEAARSGQKRKILTFNLVNEKQLRMLDVLAAQIPWPRRDSYERFCYKLFNAPRPRNPREVDRLAAILRSMIERQVLAYYRKLLEGSHLSVERLREIAISHLTKPESVEYLRCCSWDRLAIGLYAQKLKVCGDCLDLKFCLDFGSVAASKCGACRAATRQKTVRSWFANNKRRRADYMRRYRSGKAAHPFPGTRHGAREQENQDPRPDRSDCTGSPGMVTPG